MARSVAIVSDSTSVDEEMAARLGVVVVPLQVVIGARSYAEGSATSPDDVAEALTRRQPVSTSRPAPQAFQRVYEKAARAGAEAIVSIHLSGEVSGTCESAELAARSCSVPVLVVDSRHLGMGAGFAVETAAAVLDAGGTADEAADAARKRAAATTALFYVDTLEFLRRGGRVGAAAAIVGSALAVKPLLKVDDGRIVPLEKVRTSGRALARLEALAVDAAGVADVDIAVSHLANADRAKELAEHLRARVQNCHTLVANQVGAVIGAHVGPGMLAVVVAPR
ncbi:MAG: DegV family protein [uncultured Nocardioidaceae bacterium]|uniref:DegV family protein n=1 Tax=uncultured Nocardioidaceae bacterium TaxID=253824 RepID=A0A6J4MXA1_9ACTN|nr:MAG: DegV family protein [uncultured Nocardioidaceae bacterium]